MDGSRPAATCAAPQHLGSLHQAHTQAQAGEALEDSPRVMRQLLCRLQVPLFPCTGKPLLLKFQRPRRTAPRHAPAPVPAAGALFPRTTIPC